jgi:hypothetical protein
MMRVEAARRVFPRCWFNEARLKPDVMRWAIITSGAMTRATWGLDQPTTGLQTRQTVLAIWRSVTKSLNLLLLGAVALYTKCDTLRRLHGSLHHSTCSC